MKVYVVFEEDRGCGVSVVGVYRSREAAESVALQSSHYFLEESVLED